jgi:hypothetical protein
VLTASVILARQAQAQLQPVMSLAAIWKLYGRFPWMRPGGSL